MSLIPNNLYYTESHEWVLHEGGDVVSVGITDHAQMLLGDLVFVEIPEVGAKLVVGDECAVVESVKAASDVYAPVSGVVVEGNAALEDAPEIINTDAYQEGWLFKLKLADASDLERLLDAEAYQTFCADDDH
jgi:glycine cleavage system H protein